jgi:hypothetical protein
MFPIKRIEKIYQELNHYYLQVIAFQDKDSQYQDIVVICCYYLSIIKLKFYILKITFLKQFIILR